MQHMGWREKLALARRSRGLGQIEVGEIAQVRQGTVSGCESGKSYPKLDTLIKIAQALDVDLSWLFSDQLPDEMPSPPDPEESAARVLFERRLKSLGARTVLDMLDDVPINRRPIETTHLSEEPPRQYKRPDPPRRPLVPEPSPVPGDGGHPPEIQLQDLPSNRDPVPRPKGKR
jgi:transcriptional regulator with XRE-family HTH domain